MVTWRQAITAAGRRTGCENYLADAKPFAYLAYYMLLKWRDLARVAR